MRRWETLTVAITAVVLSLTGCGASNDPAPVATSGPASSSAASTSPAPTLGGPSIDSKVRFDPGCGSEEPQVRPMQPVQLYCDANGHDAVEIDAWRYWGSTSALADVTRVVNTCEPSCAVGETVEHPSVMLLDRVKSTDEGGPQFTRMILAAVKEPHAADAPSDDDDPYVDDDRPTYPQ